MIVKKIFRKKGRTGMLYKLTTESKYLRMDQVKFVEGSL